MMETALSIVAAPAIATALPSLSNQLYRIGSAAHVMLIWCNVGHHWSSEAWCAVFQTNRADRGPSGNSAGDGSYFPSPISMGCQVVTRLA